MHREAMETLRDWLKDGAPHVMFHMYHGLSNVHSISFDESHLPTECKITEGLGDCGTVCCIAGAAVFLNMSDTWKKQCADDLDFEQTWQETGQRALRILGLRQTPTNDRRMMHDLFDPVLAPASCTPLQAAQAVQNMLDGNEPWEGIT